MLSMGDVFCGLMMIDGCIWYCYHYYMSDGEYHYKDAGANITYFRSFWKKAKRLMQKWKKIPLLVFFKGGNVDGLGTM